MKHFNRSHLAIVPLLSVLTMSPTMVEQHIHGRSIASVEVCSKDHPKYDALVSKIDTKSLMKGEDLSLDKFKAKRDEVQDKIVTQRLRMETNKTDEEKAEDKEAIKEQRKDIEELVAQLAVVDSSQEALRELQSIDKEDDEASKKIVENSKKILEELIDDLDANEALIAKVEEPKQEDKKEDKKEEKKETKKDDSKKEEKPQVADKDEKKEEVECKDEKTKVLTTQVEKLVEQQTLILQNLLSMSQSMLSMMQSQLQQQNNMYSMMYGNRVNQSPYQYNSPVTAGNWVYYPQGLQPQQQNIFAQSPLQTQGYYPDSVYQNGANRNNWTMAPTYNFTQSPSYQAQQYIPGSFGAPYNFNMGSPMQNMSQPLVSL